MIKTTPEVLEALKNGHLDEFVRAQTAEFVKTNTAPTPDSADLTADEQKIKDIIFESGLGEYKKDILYVLGKVLTHFEKTYAKSDREVDLLKGEEERLSGRKAPAPPVQFVPGAIVVPTYNPNMHDYTIGEPVMLLDAGAWGHYALKMNGRMGNHLSSDKTALRVASEDEITAFLAKLDRRAIEMPATS